LHHQQRAVAVLIALLDGLGYEDMSVHALWYRLGLNGYGISAFLFFFLFLAVMMMRLLFV